ncbi:MAG: YihY/virulence factor BrkB family protein [Candidatus Palauibacterales bacterium]|nr:YihY/virulence factor BrkB family protein [Candidatus Palauibacterales bacterium]
MASELWDALREYSVRVFEKSVDDNIFVLASGLTFSILVAAIPFLLIIVALASLTLAAAAQASGIEPIDQLRHYLDVIVPVLSSDFATLPERNLPEEVIEWVVTRGQAIGLISFVAFTWFSTRLFGSLRAVLREILDLRQSRGLIQGKIFDAEMVLVSSVLFILNIGVTISVNLGKARGFRFLGLSPTSVGILETIYAAVASLVFIFVLFLLVYKFLPARRVPWRMALTAATFTAICWELLKLGFSVYLTRFADYSSVYGGLATLIIVVIWVYYLSVAFVLGAEVAQVHELRRVRRLQMEVLE